jgi:hypothetical protein
MRNYREYRKNCGTEVGAPAIFGFFCEQYGVDGDMAEMLWEVRSYRTAVLRRSTDFCSQLLHPEPASRFRFEDLFSHSYFKGENLDEEGNPVSVFVTLSDDCTFSS